MKRASGFLCGGPSWEIFSGDSPRIGAVWKKTPRVVLLQGGLGRIIHVSLIAGRPGHPFSFSLRSEAPALFRLPVFHKDS